MISGLPNAHDKLVIISPPLRYSMVPNFICMHLYDMYELKYKINWFNSQRELNFTFPSPNSRIRSTDLMLLASSASQYLIRKIRLTVGSSVAFC